MARIDQSPVGRILWGHPLKPVKKTDEAGKVITDDNGEPVMVYQMGFAVRKEDFGPISEAMQAAAAEEFPQGVPGNFAWKTKDGDNDTDAKGNPLSKREGYAGCYVLSLQTQIPVQNFAWDYSNNKWIECDTIKRGDYAKLALDIKAHKAVNAKAKPGLYLNHSCVTLWQIGQEIKGAEQDPNALGFTPPPPQQPPQEAAPPQQAAAPPSGAPGGAPGSAPGGAPGTKHTDFLKGPKAPGA